MKTLVIHTMLLLFTVTNAQAQILEGQTISTWKIENLETVSLGQKQKAKYSKNEPRFLKINKNNTLVWYSKNANQKAIGKLEGTYKQKGKVFLIDTGDDIEKYMITLDNSGKK